jgi:hypothetical protein
LVYHIAYRTAAYRKLDRISVSTVFGGKTDVTYSSPSK